MNEFYESQSGSGIASYGGVRYQKGHGFLGRFFKGTMMPLFKKALPYLGGLALESAGDIAQSVREGESFKQASKNTMKRKGLTLADKGLQELRKMAGEGKRRRRRKTRKANSKSLKVKTRKRKTTTKKKGRRRLIKNTFLVMQ